MLATHTRPLSSSRACFGAAEEEYVAWTTRASRVGAVAYSSWVTILQSREHTLLSRDDRRYHVIVLHLQCDFAATLESHDHCSHATTEASLTTAVMRPLNSAPCHRPAACKHHPIAPEQVNAQNESTPKTSKSPKRIKLAGKAHQHRHQHHHQHQAAGFDT